MFTIRVIIAVGLVIGLSTGLLAAEKRIVPKQGWIGAGVEWLKPESKTGSATQQYNPKEIGVDKLKGARGSYDGLRQGMGKTKAGNARVRGRR